MVVDKGTYLKYRTLISTLQGVICQNDILTRLEQHKYKDKIVYL